MKKTNKLPYTININDLLKLNDHCHVYIIDLDNRILNCNQTQLNNIQEITGTNNPQDIVGIPLNDIFSSKIIDMIDEEHKAVIKAKKPLLFYNTWTTPTLKKMNLLTLKTPLYNHDQTLVGILGVSFYLSEFQMDQSNLVYFTKMEKEYLTYLLRGKTAKEIATILNRSPKTIEDISARIKIKLNCKNKSELIDKALNIGVWSNKSLEATSESYSPGTFIPMKKKKE